MRVFQSRPESTVTLIKQVWDDRPPLFDDCEGRPGEVDIIARCDFTMEGATL